MRKVAKFLCILCYVIISEIAITYYRRGGSVLFGGIEDL